MNHRIRSLGGFAVLMAGILLFAHIAFAGPTITGVSGAFTTGASATISGYGFGAKNPAKPLLWADFESSINPSELGLTTSWDTMGLAWSTECALGTHCVKANDTTGDWSASIIHQDVMAPSNKIYISRYSKKNFNFPTNITGGWKWLRFWPTSGGSYPNWYIGRDAIITEDHAAAVYVRYFTEPNYPTDWWVDEFVIKASSRDGAADGVVQWLLNNSSVISVSDMIMRDTGTSTIQGRAFPIHFVGDNLAKWSPAWSSTNRVWADNVYMDTTWARVVIGDASTYKASKITAPQIPSAWSDSSLSVTVNLGPLKSASKVYLYVFDANGTVNDNGYEVAVGGSSVARPSPPANLVAQ